MVWGVAECFYNLSAIGARQHADEHGDLLRRLMQVEMVKGVFAGAEIATRGAEIGFPAQKPKHGWFPNSPIDSIHQLFQSHVYVICASCSD